MSSDDTSVEGLLHFKVFQLLTIAKINRILESLAYVGTERKFRKDLKDLSEEILKFSEGQK